MRKLGIALILAVLPLAAWSQEESTAQAPHDGGLSEVLQSIYIPPLHNAPFSAIVHTEWAKPLAGGGTSTLVNQRRIIRDRDGRLYEERWLLVPKNGKYQSAMNLQQIYDPNRHTGYDCFLLGPQKGHCELRNFAGLVRKEAALPAGPLPGKNGFRTHEDLGIRMIEGVETTGSRDTTTINAGVMGNDQPMKIVRETWHSSQLGINLISILSDPRIGTQTFTLSNIEVTEPDPQYFELPEGFQIVDSRRAEDQLKGAQPAN
jgi:hypothetical protein